MPPEDNPADEIEITKEEWQAGEINRLTRERDELRGKLEEIRKYLDRCGDVWGVKPDILAIINRR